MSIVMGNDELILYVRKHNSACKMKNDELAKNIWNKISQDLDKNAKIVVENSGTYWDFNCVAVAPDKLPKSAAQFEFDRNILPKLYDYLDSLS